MYLGYQLEVNGVKLPIPDGEETSVIVPGSFSVQRDLRVANEWTDATGKTHRDVYYTGAPKKAFSFTIKDHSSEQHKKLIPLINNVGMPMSASYFDDALGDYRATELYIESIDSVTSIATNDDVYYGGMSVTLKEF